MFLGPRLGKRGHFAPPARWAADPAPAARLWRLSEEATGVTYAPGATAGGRPAGPL